MTERTYIEDMISRYPALAECADDIERAFEAMRDCYASGGTVLMCGNGGSAADAEHWTGELMKAFEKSRPLSPEDRGKLPPGLADRLQGALPTIPLTGFLSLSSAYANDVDSKYIFAQMVWALGRPDGVLIGITTSGNSENVLLALQTAAAIGMKTIALTGGKGGASAGIADICIRAPSDITHIIQEYHVPVYHCLSQMLESAFFGD